MESTRKPWPIKIMVGSFIVACTIMFLVTVLLAPVMRSAHAEGEQLQSQLVQVYDISTAELRFCLDESPVVRGVIQQEDPPTKDRLTGVISQFKPDTAVTQNMMAAQLEGPFSQLDQIRLDQLSEVAVACRDVFLDSQRDNQAQAQALDDWDNNVVNLLFQLFLGSSLPNDKLVVIGPDGEKLYSDAALQFILEPTF